VATAAAAAAAAGAGDGAGAAATAEKKAAGDPGAPVTAEKMAALAPSAGREGHGTNRIKENRTSPLGDARDERRRIATFIVSTCLCIR